MQKSLFFFGIGILISCLGFGQQITQIPSTACTGQTINIVGTDLRSISKVIFTNTKRDKKKAVIFYNDDGTQLLVQITKDLKGFDTIYLYRKNGIHFQTKSITIKNCKNRINITSKPSSPSIEIDKFPHQKRITLCESIGVKLNVSTYTQGQIKWYKNNKIFKGNYQSLYTEEEGVYHATITSNGKESEKSNSITVFALKPTILINSNTSTQLIDCNESIFVRLSIYRSPGLSDAKYTYQWQKSENGKDWKNENSVNSYLILSGKKEVGHYRVRLIHKKTNCKSLFSDVIKIGELQLSQSLKPLIEPIEGECAAVKRDFTILNWNQYFNYTLIKKGEEKMGRSLNKQEFSIKQEGTYYVIIKNKCRKIQSKTFNVQKSTINNPIIASINSSNTICESGNTKLIIKNPQKGLVYQWYENGKKQTHKGIEYIITKKGEYAVYATIKGCLVKSNKIMINKIELPKIEFKEIPNVICKGENAILEIDNSKEFTQFQWYNHQELLSGENKKILKVKKEGNYYVKVKKGECFHTSKEISPKFKESPSKPQLQASSLSQIPITLTATGAKKGEYYRWEHNNTILNTNTSIIEVQSAGMYKVCISDSNCLSEPIYKKIEDFKYAEPFQEEKTSQFIWLKPNFKDNREEVMRTSANDKKEYTICTNNVNIEIAIISSTPINEKTLKLLRNGVIYNRKKNIVKEKTKDGEYKYIYKENLYFHQEGIYQISLYYKDLGKKISSNIVAINYHELKTSLEKTTLQWNTPNYLEYPNGYTHRSKFLDIKLNVRTPYFANKKDFILYVNGQPYQGQKFDEEEIEEKSCYVFIYKNKIYFPKSGIYNIELRLNNVKSASLIVDYQENNLKVLSIGPTVENLKHTATDAEKFIKTFKRQNNSKYNAANFKLLYGKEATKREIDRSIEKLKENTTSSDILMLFISTHGILINDKFYITPSDYDPKTPQSTAVSFKSIFEQLDAVESKKIIFVDVCHSGLIEKILQEENKKNYIFFTSSDENFSFESTNYYHSIFAYALLNGIGTVKENAKADTNKDGIIYSDELYEYLKKEVAKIAKEENRIQKPLYFNTFKNQENFPIYTYPKN